MAKPNVRETRRKAARGRPQHDPERWTRLLVIGGVIAVVAIAIGFIGFGYWDSQIRPKGKTVLRVGDTEVSLGQLERRMELYREEDPTFSTPGQHLLQLPDIVLDELEREALLLEGASELDISVTEEEVDAEIRSRGGLEDDVEPREFAQEYRRQVDESGLSTDEYRQMITASVLEEKVRNYFLFLSPDAEAQVQSRWIALDDEAAAEDAYGQLESGADFEELAGELSPEFNSEEGNVVGWRTRGNFPSRDIEEFLFEEAGPGEYSEVVDAGGRFYIVQLVERDEERELDESQQQLVADRNMAEWLAELTTQLSYERDLSEEDAIKALDDIGVF